MAEFQDALNNILADPDAMGQIMALAGKLGGGSSASPPPEPEPEAFPEPPAPPEYSEPTEQAGGFPDLEQLGQMGRLLELFHSTPASRQESMALIQALRPFLRPAQQGKVDRALKLAGLSQTARQVYQLWKEGELHV